MFVQKMRLCADALYSADEYAALTDNERTVLAYRHADLVDYVQSARHENEVYGQAKVADAAVEMVGG